MPNRPVQILYIDDDPALARLVERFFARRGYKVESVSTAEEGLARLDRDDISVIALDHYLPTGTGLDFLASLAGREKLPPIVYVTGTAEMTIAVAALKAGAFDYVAKTTGEEFLELLGTAVDQAVEKGRLQRAKERADAEVREARDRAEVLLHEVNHRVANSLALVAALVRMQANAISDAGAKEALAETQVRISAIAGVHRRLYTSDDVRFVEISGYLSSLLGELEVTMRDSGRISKIHLDAEPLKVPTDKAVPIGVIVTELVTNAFKYAYPPDAPGPIRVSMARTGDRSVTLSVADEGVGWSGSGTAQGTGMGTRVVKAMASSLGCTPTYEGGGGTTVTLAFDL